MLNVNSKNYTLMNILKDMNLNISTNPRGTDKGDFKTYVKGFYEREFTLRRNVKNRILEIGVRSGASIALWANFFKDAEIIGVDVEQVGSPAGPLREYLDYPIVNFYCQDAYSFAFSDFLSGKFTIMIDDGPHSLASQKRFIELYLPKLDEGGVLIIEDVQREYRDSFHLMRRVPRHAYVFEIYDFRKNSNTGDDFLFVVRHNKDGKNQNAKRIYVFLLFILSWARALFRRLKSWLS